MCNKTCRECNDFFMSIGQCGHPMTATVDEIEGHRHIKVTPGTPACGYFTEKKEKENA